MRNNIMLSFLLLLFIFIFVIAFTPTNSQSSVTEIIPVCFNPLIYSNENCVNSVTYQYNKIPTSGNYFLICNPISQIYNTQKIIADTEIKNVLKYPMDNISNFLFFNKLVSNINLNTTITLKDS